MGLRRQTVRLQVYAHALDGPEQVWEWVKGTTFTRFKARLAPEAYAAFVDAYRLRFLRLAAEEEAQAGQPYLCPFKRILLWVQA